MGKCLYIYTKCFSCRLIKDAYLQIYKKPLQEDVRGDTSGDFKRLLISMCTAHREEGPCNTALAPGIAQALYKAGKYFFLC